ncbi:Periodic tryptophan protein 2 -like protein [Halotydeus destructor]|nr:Periodic tryptophan protein 2 -like protein [Halotydeus destructor]
MKFAYKFSNVLGSVYHKGNVEFTPDGNTVLSPVGNKIVCYDLKNNRSTGLPIEVEYNLSNIALNHNGSILLAATEKTQVYLCSMISGTVLHRKDFRDLGRITALSFSPNGRYFVVCGGNKALIYLTPGVAFGGNRELSPFKIHKVIKAHYDETTCITWSSDSNLVAIGSKDLSVKIFPVRNLRNVPSVISLSGHSAVITKCFFADDASKSLDLYSLSKNGQVCAWQANVGEDELDKEDDDTLLSYSKEKRVYLTENLKTSDKSIKLTAADYHPKLRILVSGYSNGSFLINELPGFSVIYSLELSTSGRIDTLSINRTGDWIAIGSGVRSARKEDALQSSSSQLVVWEWQSETFVLKQSGTGAGTANLVECLSYSPDGSTLVTGSTDGKIKLWNTFTGFCYATFSEEHKGPVTCIEFLPNKGGKVILSGSLDGTVRAFDLNRYRNFRTLTGPGESKPAQFTCLSVDSVGGDFVAAGSHNLFEVFLWSLQTGRLLECLTGHEGPVSAVKFSPTSETLVSCSWDGTIRIWDLFGTKCTRDVIEVNNDIISLAFKPDGSQFAVSTLNGRIIFFDPNSGSQIDDGIDGQHDLEMSQSENELSRTKNKHFMTLCYSMDGEYIIGGGKSKFMCMYNVKEKILTKKFAVTWNLSMDGMYEYISRRRKAEFGFNVSQIAERENDERTAGIALPGVARGDYSSKAVNPMIAVTSVQFSPTMRAFSATTTEGVMVYSLDVSSSFDPFHLEEGITETSIRKALILEDYGSALMQAFKLNEKELITEVFEAIPTSEISMIVSSLQIAYVERCFRHLAICLESSRHVEFYLFWVKALLEEHGVALKNRPLAAVNSVLRLIHRNLSRHMEDIGKICDNNQYMLDFILSVGET